MKNNTQVNVHNENSKLVALCDNFWQAIKKGDNLSSQLIFAQLENNPEALKLLRENKWLVKRLEKL